MKVTASTDHPGGMTILIHDNAHQSKHVRKQMSGMPASKGKAIHGGMYNAHQHCKPQHKPAFVSKAKRTLATRKEIHKKKSYETKTKGQTSVDMSSKKIWVKSKKRLALEAEKRRREAVQANLLKKFEREMQEQRELKWKKGNVPKPRFVNENDVINSFADLSIKEHRKNKSSLIEQHQKTMLKILDANYNDIILALAEDTAHNVPKAQIDKFTNKVQARCNTFMEKVILYSPTENLETVKAKHRRCHKNECKLLAARNNVSRNKDKNNVLQGKLKKHRSQRRKEKHQLQPRNYSCTETQKCEFRDSMYHTCTDPYMDVKSDEYANMAIENLQHDTYMENCINELYDPTKWNQELLDSLPMNENNSENIIDEMSILSDSSDELIFQQKYESSNDDISSSDEDSSNVSFSDDQETLVFYGFPISDEKQDESGLTATETIPIEEKSTEIISDDDPAPATPSQTLITRFNSLSTNLRSRLNMINVTVSNSEEFEQHDNTEEGDENDEIDQESEQSSDLGSVFNVDYISNDPSDMPLRCTSKYKLKEFNKSKEFIVYMDPFFEILINSIRQLNENGNNHGNSHDPETCMQICLFMIKEILVRYSKQNNKKIWMESYHQSNG